MPWAVALAGLACGMLLGAVAATLWSMWRQVPALSQALRIIGWAAGAVLLIGAVTTWHGSQGLAAPSPRLMVMAAVAAPPDRHDHRQASWDTLLLLLPALMLALAGLCWIPGVIGTGGSGSTALAEASPTTTITLAAIICGGLAARALGEALAGVLTPGPFAGWASDAVYAPLTLLVGGILLADLWQRGTLSEVSTAKGGLTGAWLAWSGAFWSPRARPRLHAALTAVAALLLLCATGTQF